ncbi:MAG TPA: hypothetical protein VGF17_22435, partial [Phytomonospora sp.]
QPIPPERPLSAPNGDDARPPLFEVLRSLAPADSWWHTEQAADFAGFDEVDLVCEIDDSFMHQGSCYEHTPREVPLIAALAARDEVHPALRATLVDSLFSAATAGRRQVAQDVDRRNALGLPHDERPTELLVRQAVAATAPALLARWDDECDLVRFALGLLAAAFPEHGHPLAAELRTWAVDEGATPRGRVLHLTADLAGQDPDLDVTLAAMVADGFARTPPSPVAPAEGVAFSVLQEWAELELSAPLEAL